MRRDDASDGAYATLATAKRTWCTKSSLSFATTAVAGFHVGGYHFQDAVDDVLATSDAEAR
jgi:hypothetical protein